MAFTNTLIDLNYQFVDSNDSGNIMTLNSKGISFGLGNIKITPSGTGNFGKNIQFSGLVDIPETYLTKIDAENIYATQEDLETALQIRMIPYLTVTGCKLHYSIFQHNNQVNIKINSCISAVEIPPEIQEGQSITFYNMSDNSPTIKCDAPAFNPLYSPAGKRLFIMPPRSTFTFFFVIDSNGNEMFLVK